MSRYIDADKLLELYEIDFKKLSGDMTNAVQNMVWNVPLNVVKQNIIDQPTADVRENVRGEWIDRGKDMTIRWQCSECGRKDTHIYNFCPYCGAQMEK